MNETAMNIMAVISGVLFAYVAYKAYLVSKQERNKTKFQAHGDGLIYYY